MILKNSRKRFWLLRTLNFENLRKSLEKNPNIIFAYIFGSAGKGQISTANDLDIAVYLNYPPSFEIIADILRSTDEVISPVLTDLLVLNGCENVVLKYEALMGNLLFTKDAPFLAKYYSLALRKYEDELVRFERCRKYRRSS